MGQSLTLISSQAGFRPSPILSLWCTGKNQVWMQQHGPQETALWNGSSFRYFSGSQTGLNPSANPATGIWKQKNGATWATSRFLSPYSVGPLGIANGGLAAISMVSSWQVYNKFTLPAFNQLSEQNWDASVLHPCDSLLFVAPEKGIRKINLNDFGNTLLEADSLALLHGFTARAKRTGNSACFQKSDFSWVCFSKESKPTYMQPSFLGMPSGKIHDLVFLPNGDTLFLFQEMGSPFSEAYVHRDGETIRLRDSLPNLGSDLRFVENDRTGKIWMTSEAGYLYRIGNQAVSSYFLGESGKAPTCFSLDSSGNKWIGTSNGSLIRFSDILPKIKHNHPNPGPICPGKPIQFSDSSRSIAGEIVERTWYFGDGDSSALANPRHEFGQFGTYIVSLFVRDVAGNEAITRDTLIFYPQPDLVVYPTSKQLETCLGDSLRAFSSSLLEWKFEGQMVSSNKTIFVSQPGWYRVVANEKGCLITDSILVIKKAGYNFGVDIRLENNMLEGDLVRTVSNPVVLQFAAQNNPGFCDLAWELNSTYIGSGETANANLGTGNYSINLKGKTPAGCEISGSRNFTIEALDFPNLITANGDGKNDLFEIPGTQISNLTLYNRWGKEIFLASPYQNNWPSSNVGPGTYFYRLEAGGKSYSGWVMVVR